MEGEVVGVGVGMGEILEGGLGLGVNEVGVKSVVRFEILYHTP